MLNNDTVLTHFLHVESYIERNTIHIKKCVLCLLASYYINEQKIPIVGITSLTRYVFYQNICTSTTNTIIPNIVAELTIKS